MFFFSTLFNLLARDNSLPQLPRGFQRSGVGYMDTVIVSFDTPTTLQDTNMTRAYFCRGSAEMAR
jgi:hypothetical protein